MLEQADISNILFLDIETVPQYPSYEDMPENWQKLWIKKAQFLKRDEQQTESDIYNRAGIYAEFGKIVCITVGFFYQQKFRIKSLYGHNEAEILRDFCDILSKKKDFILCAHNGKEFDFPYLSRRCLINGIQLPDILNNSGKKPWEVLLLDTMELWKFGDFKSFTSLELLAACFNIQTPKDDIDGSEVWKVYWQEKNLERIKNYCQKDVITIARILLKFKNLNDLSFDSIEYIN